MKVYLAGPDVFLHDAPAFGARKVALCARYGMTGLFPLDNKVDITAAAGAAREIFLGNQRMMDQADAIVANLTPFRGPSADAGTVYELGYMIGRGKRALGYCNDPTSYADRVARSGPLTKDANGKLTDSDDLMVENFGGADNLMITESLATRFAPLIVTSQMIADPMRDLTAFECCLQLLKSHSAS